MRSDGRGQGELRPFSIEPNFIRAAAGSVLVRAGDTRVICTACVAAETPAWVSEGGWLTAEYAMLPGATSPRGRRDAGGRGKEIQRLIGRSLRAAVELGELVDDRGGISIVCDCDVIDADGGTRTAAITGAYVALRLALDSLVQQGRLATLPALRATAAVSVGLVERGPGGALDPLLDLCYREDSQAHVDLNVVGQNQGQDQDQGQGIGLVEVQGTGERGTFSRPQLAAMLDLAEQGIQQLLVTQQRVLEEGV